MNVMTAEMTSEMEALKARLKATWMSGDYGHFAKYLEPGALEFLSRIPIEPGTARTASCDHAITCEMGG